MSIDKIIVDKERKTIEVLGCVSVDSVNKYLSENELFDFKIKGFDGSNSNRPTFTEVKLVYENSNLLYFIPIFEYHSFLSDLYQADMSGEYEAFNIKYHKYVRNPAEVRLYVSES